MWSALDTGTEVELIIPGARAYAAPRPRGPRRLIEKLFAQSVPHD